MPMRECIDYYSGVTNCVFSQQFITYWNSRLSFIFTAESESVLASPRICVNGLNLSE